MYSVYPGLILSLYLIIFTRMTYNAEINTKDFRTELVSYFECTIGWKPLSIYKKNQFYQPKHNPKNKFKCKTEALPEK